MFTSQNIDALRTLVRAIRKKTYKDIIIIMQLDIKSTYNIIIK